MIIFIEIAIVLLSLAFPYIKSFWSDMRLRRKYKQKYKDKYRGYKKKCPDSAQNKKRFGRGDKKKRHGNAQNKNIMRLFRK